MSFEIENKLISDFMGYQALFCDSWDWIMKVGDEMEKHILDGNWGLYEQFFSDEMRSYDYFERACKDRNRSNAILWVKTFIEALEHQDPEILKKAKEDGN